MQSINEFHEVANIFPMMSGDEYADLVADIRANGLIEPIWTHAGKIIDGRNRYRACVESGVKPEYRKYTGKEAELVSFVVSLNLKRRHLNETQRAVVAGRLANMTKSDAANTRWNASANLQLHSKIECGDCHNPNPKWKQTDNAPDEREFMQCTYCGYTILAPGQSAKITQASAAAMLNVSPRTVASVKAVERKAPDLLERMERGEMTAHEAEKEVKTRERKQARSELAASAASVKPSERWNVYTGDIRTWQAPRQYDYIITDPPYPREFLPLYSVLAERAAEWLKPGGLLIAMSAHYYMPELYQMLGEHLDYFWTAAYMVSGESAGVFQKHIIPQWKPLIMYTRKGDNHSGRQFSDVFRSPANDKDNHKWGQSVGGMLDIVSKICLPGQYILDPFCGAGTTGIAALEHGCLFDGLEIDEQNAKISRARIGEASK